MHTNTRSRHLNRVSNQHRTLAALAVAGLVLATVMSLLAEPTATAGSASTAQRVAAPTITYTVTAKPGTPLTVAWTQPGVTYPTAHGWPVYPYRTVTVPASGTWTTTVPADGWLGGSDVPVLSALPAEGLMPRTDAPGFDCTITQDGWQLVADNEPNEYRCLTSTSPTYRR